MSVFTSDRAATYPAFIMHLMSRHCPMLDTVLGKGSVDALLTAVYLWVMHLVFAEPCECHLNTLYLFVVCRI